MCFSRYELGHAFVYANIGTLLMLNGCNMHIDKIKLETNLDREKSFFSPRNHAKSDELTGPASAQVKKAMAKIKMTTVFIAAK